MYHSWSSKSSEWTEARFCGEKRGTLAASEAILRSGSGGHGVQESPSTRERRSRPQMRSFGGLRLQKVDRV
ncbi:uncharacterized protein APUU_70546S [Aspergillus puulaauensis]|uniref:Uncharacterized protein n=1 Tax=Aspergillus puulaauensis TaxID=1220207 RepID=A0A7R8AS11_9EURO|nr:uncharacterized protein APUU_70546S [Aspergillus puulaauensis]BCS28976.1 hypothetical protein APUU_70546S [Aspergillus puulaauensis]